MRVSIFGLGYVGAVTAASLAKRGHDVLGVDLNEEKVALVKAGHSPVVEPGLSELLGDAVAHGHLRATTSPDEAVSESDLALICVGTPSGSSGQLDLTALARVAEQIGQALRRLPRVYTVVIRSTVLPGTTEQLVIPALQAASGAEVGRGLDIAVNPEFMREGSSLRDFLAPPMTLVGSDRPGPLELLRALYAGVDAPFVATAVRTAEMVKYVSNSFHALKVSFANEIGDLCEALGADAQDVMRIFRMDHKLNVSEAYLRPGFAFGGSCLPKDLRALLAAGRRVEVPVPLLAAILPSNEAQINRAISRVLETKQRKIGVVGLAFKVGTDDLRESPLVRLVEALIGKGCAVRILDPSVSVARLRGANRHYIEEEIPHISTLLCDSADELLQHAEVLVVGNLGEEACAVLKARRADQRVIDLNRGALDAS
jgi:GDP-mannose 6-dehydrogenase